MLHLRAVCPPEATAQALDVLRAHAGTAHLIAHRGVAVEPPGDLVEADIAREAADEIVDALCGLGLDHTGGITLEALDTALSDAADRAEGAAPGEGADVVLRRGDLLRRASAALGVGFPLAMVVKLGGALLVRATGVFGEEAFQLERNHDVDFVFSVGVPSLVVAMLAGAAGMLAMSSAKSAALVGQWSRCLQSAGQLLVNLLGIVAAAAIVLTLRRNGQRSRVGTRPLSRG